ncbi:hypothetical protein THIOM_002621 [Candidatus Thiomargarita nelsonii]|uniref:Uncharacterized protein n=1 Tax=Candidatus Thiomargarita nelsonii TaxID=1003181 RepID=A0A176S0Y4_9GAMM|nr:hypothetical protein THIOM_002621 [Candidatus Thiomargarita nelsonii]
MIYFGDKPWLIGIRHPNGTDVLAVSGEESFKIILVTLSQSLWFNSMIKFFTFLSDR